MTYTVRFKRIADQKLMQELTFASREEALAEAEFSIIGGQGPVEVVVVDDHGQEYFKGVYGDM